jgi:recombination protein RecT
MVTNSLTNLKKKLGLTAYLTQDAVKDQINKVVGGKDGQQFITSIVSAVQANPQLQECTNTSILSSALLGQSLKLSPSPQLGHYYMMPFKNNKNNTTEAQFVMGYKGMIQLAIRSGYYKRLNVLAIKEGELVRYNPLDEDIEVNLIEDEEQREAAPTIGYYAMFEYTNGFKKAIYWSKKRMEAHALRYSAGYKAKKGYTFWEKDFDAMAYKTMLRQLISKWGIMSIDMQQAYESDQAVIREDGSKDYVDIVEAPNSPQIDKVEETDTNTEKTSPQAQSEATEPQQSDVAAALFS